MEVWDQFAGRERSLSRSLRRFRYSLRASHGKEYSEVFSDGEAFSRGEQMVKLSHEVSRW